MVMIGLSTQEHSLSSYNAKDYDDFSEHYIDFLARYSRSRRPIEVDFRKLVSFHSGIERHTHLVHFYPAKLLLNIPYFFLHCNTLTEGCKTVLDPFCGSGTVLLEAILSGRTAFGADSNPLARLLSKVKTSRVQHDSINRSLTRVVRNSELSNEKLLHPQELIDWKHWYDASAYTDLCRLSYQIRKTRNLVTREFLEVCLSQTARKVSMADPKVTVPVKLNPEKPSLPELLKKQAEKHLKKVQETDVIKAFEKITRSNLSRATTLNKVKSLGKVQSIMNNAMDLNDLEDNSIDLIITSPPYAGAQKYIRSSSHSIGWLQLSPDDTLRSLERLNIGREHYSKDEYAEPQKPNARGVNQLLNRVREKNPLRAHIASNYLIEMEQCLSECYRVLNEGGTFVLVIGNNIVCGESFNSRSYMQSICQRLGFHVELILRDDINSRGLMTKRNKTASVIACEWIIVLKKK